MKTHKELGISAKEHAALIATIEVLRTEQIVFDMSRACSVHPNNWDDDDRRRELEMFFKNGDNTAHPQPACGTACCIGGTMSLLMQNGMKLPARITPEMGKIAQEYVYARDEPGEPLKALFWDSTEGDEEPAEGIAAIEQFLAGNTRAPWQTM